MFRIITKSILLLILSICLLSTFFYYPTTIYTFPKTKPFSGDSLYNPYTNLNKIKLRANFHAHSIAWNGITNGHNSEEEIYQAYQNEGYNIIGISNYHQISRYGLNKSDIYIPVYEHGVNIGKSHLLVLNANDVSFMDFPLFQTISQQQSIIDHLKDKGEYLILAHPKFGGGRQLEDVSKLVGYRFMEVVSKSANSFKYWDGVLSSGKLVWIIGNDDTHDLVKEPPFKNWNIIHSNSNAKNVLEAMSHGASYAQKSINGNIDNSLTSCEIENGILNIQLDNIADSIHLIGQHATILSKSYNTDRIQYVVADDDTYVRAEVFNKSSQFFLNPIVRSKNGELPYSDTLKAEEDLFKTWLFRFFLFLVSLFIIWLMRKIILR